MNLTLEQALAQINKSNGTNYKSFEEIQQFLSASPNGNERLINMLNKITKMIIGDSFRGELLNSFTNIFTLANQTIEVGALAEIVDAALIEAVDDIIKDKTDYLPSGIGAPAQYVLRAARNVQKKIPLEINESIYVRAFTALQPYNSFLNLITKRIKDGMYKFTYDFVMTEIFAKQVFNKQDLGSSSSGEFMINIYNYLVSRNPYTSEMNLGADFGKANIPLERIDSITSNPDGMPVKTNTLEISHSSDGTFGFPDLVLITSGLLEGQLIGELADIYHSKFISPRGKFASVISIAPAIYAQMKTSLGLATTQDFVIVLDKRSLYMGTFQKLNKAQF